jgi:FKBP-type peptidyl-prolyl cis-trans isomerase SlyD
MIRRGSKVTIRLEVRADGRSVGATRDDRPYTFIQGMDPVLQGLQDGLEGLDAGDRTTVVLPPERGFGKRDPSRVRTIPRGVVQGDDDVEIGDHVRGRLEGTPFLATVTDIEDDRLAVDMNHPLAGKTLEYEVEVVSVEPSSLEDGRTDQEARGRSA